MEARRVHIPEAAGSNPAPATENILKHRNMTKTYKAKTSIGINVVLPTGKNMHISFISQSDGGSIFVTGDEDIQRALESHYRFGALFRLVSAGEVQRMPDMEGQGYGDDWTDEGAGNPEVVRVSDLGMAKEYLAENCGAMRSKLRSQKQITDYAASKNIVFEGLD